MVKSQLAEFVKGNGRVEKEIKMFEDAGQYDAYIKEASTLTGSGAGIGGRTAYDPVFASLRLENPMRGVSRSVATDGSTYQFRANTRIVYDAIYSMVLFYDLVYCINAFSRIGKLHFILCSTFN